MNNCTQQVVLNGVMSTWREVCSRVPQNSVLGPVLFNILIIGMLIKCEDAKMKLGKGGYIKPQKKALEDYVDLPDSHYSYTLVSKEELPAVTVYTINMTSLKWLDDSEVDKTVWWHLVTIAVPKVYKNPQMKKSCFLVLDGNSNSFIQFSANQIKNIAITTGSVAVHLNQIPFQPLTFYKHPFGKKNISENHLFAYALWRFVNDPNASTEWLIQFPMVKATVRAMDTVTNFLQKQIGDDEHITRFMLVGSSKRGWIAWLTTAIDQRVVAFVSIVMDFLNFVENFHHQYRSYCGWSFTLEAFYELNMTQQMDYPRFRLLTSYVDPLEYNELYENKTKYLFVATGDEIFQPDNSKRYFEQLKGEKYLRIIPNTNHWLMNNKDSPAIPIISFYLISIQNQQHPQVHWKRILTNTGGTIYFFTDWEPSQIQAYYTNTSDDRRIDFRMYILSGQAAQRNPIEWKSVNVEKLSTSVYRKQMKNPKKGWRGFFIEATYSGFGDSDDTLVITSELHVIPDRFPCDDCSGEECYGKLV